jgi:hypothetical protein
MYRLEFEKPDLVGKMMTSIQSTIGVLFFLQNPPLDSKYDQSVEHLALAQFSLDLMSLSLKHVDELIQDLMDQFEEHGILMDTGESQKWEIFLPVLKLVIRFLASKLFLSFSGRTNTTALLKNIGTLATKISRLQKEVYAKFPTTNLPWFEEDIALKGYAPLEGTWFADEDSMDQTTWEDFDMVRMRCHQFILGAERLSELQVIIF